MVSVHSAEMHIAIEEKCNTDKGTFCAYVNKIKDSGLYNVILHFYTERVISHQALTHHSITMYSSLTCLLKLFFSTCTAQQKVLCIAKPLKLP